ncbi:MAG: hypothetical protein E6K04_08180 [Methanobacteriota archaeon]|nr:MAG: hypothetical protein E6K04_08180 [Euryarchaeota archaeon]
MTAERQKIRAAEWLYRWNLSSSIIGIVFTILTFMGVFTLVLGPIFTERFGFTYFQTALLLFLFVLGVIIGFGVYLDKVLKSLRALLEAEAMDESKKGVFLAELDRSLAKVEQSIREKSWPIEPHERVY